VQKRRIDKQYVGRLMANGFGETLWILAFGKNVYIALIGNGTPHSDKRERLIVRKYNIDTGHKIYSSPGRSVRQPDSCLRSRHVPKR
jgi:hypothetical protein